MSSQRTLSRIAVLVGGIAAVLGGLWLLGRTPLSLGNIRSVEDHGAFYRLLSKYQHGDEIINFDIVVGCNVRVTRYGDGDRSYDAFRDPAVYVKAIGGGHAVMQMVPDACRGQTSENGQVPDDFLPGALWFEHADDLSFGVAYVTEDAFEGPRSQLKFLGASIHPATHADYVAFGSMAAKNLIDPRPLFSFFPIPSPDEIKAHLGDSRALTKIWPVMVCYAIKRLQLTDPAQRSMVAAYWPKTKPRYWSPTWQELKELNKQLHIYSRATVDGREARAYFRLNDHRADGFPTRMQGGTIGSSHQPWDKLPPVVFPLRHDEGIPWLTRDYLVATTLYRHVEFARGANQGLAYCYAQIPGRELGVPAYVNGNFATRIDGEAIAGELSDMRSTETATARDRPFPFFERDEFFYYQDFFGLN